MSAPDTIVISALPNIEAVDDATLFAVEDAAITQNATALQVKAYLAAAFATAAQGLLAASAVQPSAALTTAINATANGFATAAQGGLAATALQVSTLAAALITIGVRDSGGNFYVTPNLRYTNTNPPQEQTMQGGVWTTVRTVQ